MAYRRLTERALLLPVLLAGFMLQAEAANIYKYVDANGRTVFNSSVPTEYVKNGYTVLNEKGQVIEVVPRAATAEERAAQAAQAEAQRVAEEAAQAQQEADGLLLRLYRTPEEIARKRDERVGQIDAQSTTLTASLAKAESEITRLQGVIKNQGANPQPQTQELMRIQEQERDKLTTQLQRLDQDKAAAVAEAERDIKRLGELLGLPENPAAQ